MEGGPSVHRIVRPHGRKDAADSYKEYEIGGDWLPGTYHYQGNLRLARGRYRYGCGNAAHTYLRTLIRAGLDHGEHTLL